MISIWYWFDVGVVELCVDRTADFRVTAETPFFLRIIYHLNALHTNTYEHYWADFFLFVKNVGD